MTHAQDDPDFQVMITAQEAWPVFERAVLAAKSHVVASFRIFDLSTQLRSEEARKIGETWFDLLEHLLCRGVRIDLTVSDFDPVFATELHRLTWRTVRQAAALAEISDCPIHNLRIRADLHPAKAGRLPWLAFLPAVLQRRSKRLMALNDDQKLREAVRLDDGSLPELHTTSHHQKIAVIDDEVLYVGGLDLNERRYDTPQHDRIAAHTWSDVQLLIRGGPEPKEAAHHVKTFLTSIEACRKPAPMKYIRRTLSAQRPTQLPYVSPKTLLHEIEEDHIRAFKRAKDMVYIETQYFRARGLAKRLAKEGRRRPDLHAILILPGLPDEVAYSSEIGIDARYGMSLQHNAIEMVRDSFGDRIIVATPVQPRFAARDTIQTLSGSPLIHVHNKILVQDDSFAMVGSANLNGRSLYWDTEAAVRITDPGRIQTLRDRLMSHWWFEDLPAEARAHDTMFPWWSRKIAENSVMNPENRHGFLVRHDSAQLRDTWLNLPGVTENIV
ncbi:phospholipase D family protein [Roseovarius confluentis]|uniref:phospholipase D family protein n=1 Tax=Roseovarius confluentis TaxID=1852027 RepID=UPI003182DDB5